MVVLIVAFGCLYSQSRQNEFSETVPGGGAIPSFVTGNHGKPESVDKPGFLLAEPGDVDRSCSALSVLCKHVCHVGSLPCSKEHILFIKRSHFVDPASVVIRYSPSVLSSANLPTYMLPSFTPSRVLSSLIGRSDWKCWVVFTLWATRDLHWQ